MASPFRPRTFVTPSRSFSLSTFFLASLRLLLSLHALAIISPSLVRIHLQRTALPYTETKSDRNDCVKLDVKGVGNPASITYYTTFVEQGCTQFPDPLKPSFTPGPGTLNNAALSNATNGIVLLSPMTDGDLVDS